MTISVSFSKVDTYKITTVAGPNGSVTPENPEVTAGSDVKFTITPDPGYIIDTLYVDGRPEMADESGQFTIFNVQRDMTLEVDFIQAVEHTITVLEPENGSIRIEGESDPVPHGGSVITRYTKGNGVLLYYPR
ncbi:MAG: InlB B-repeat-containing protein [Clostridia bacterium]